MKIKLYHSGLGYPTLGPVTLGLVTLTTEHSASSYGQPVLIDKSGNVYGPGEVPRGYLNGFYDRKDYTPDQIAWLDDLIVAQENNESQPNGNKWPFGRRLKLDIADRLNLIPDAWDY